ncbi:MAG TPA: chemotaxis protein CheW [Gaiellaceae bacterium]|jgi:purine-binding chemotaxis protein CheW|nr:chemotaxis protein CheW [Gaiellaceae bacterium]
MAVTDAAQQLVVFSLGEEEYALPITQVQEIIRYTEPRAVASEEAWIEGVISLRGKIIPVCNLAERLGLSTERVENAKIVIVETGGGTAGVIVDEVEEVLTVEEEQLDGVPGAGSDFIEAVAKIGDRLVVLLNSDGIFAGASIATAA